MRRLVLLTVLISAMVASPAHAGLVGKVRGTAGGGLPASVGVPTPDFVLVPGGCPGRPDVVACADPAGGVVYAPAGDRFALWHEIGHVFDYRRLADSDRAWFTALLGFALDTPWNSASEAQPSEYFADAYAACALRLSPRGHREGRAIVTDWDTAYGYLPTVRQHRRVCGAIRSLSR